jgi:hypothetical protein
MFLIGYVTLPGFNVGDGKPRRVCRSRVPPVHFHITIQPTTMTTVYGTSPAADSNCQWHALNRNKVLCFIQRRIQNINTYKLLLAAKIHHVMSIGGKF